MTDIRNEYFEWMCTHVSDTRARRTLKEFGWLFEYLNERDFNYTIDMDGNRFQDGIDLRYRFGMHKKYPDAVIASELDGRPCSVLEMMVALAIRMEENIMTGNPRYGNRTSTWFWCMLESLGLAGMDDRHFSPLVAAQSIDIFLNRQYSKNGKGGLFTVKYPKEDMRTVEIWYQMCWFLNELGDI